MRKFWRVVAITTPTTFDRSSAMGLLRLCLLACLATPAVAAPDYAIEKLRGDVYRFTSGHHHAVFVVAERSIVLIDPISAPSARWLSGELKRRFSKPVRWLVYSHSHPDHVYGGEVFADAGATVVAHRLAASALKLTRARTAPPEVTFDDELALNVDRHVIRLKYHGPNNGQGSVSVRIAPENVLFVVDWVLLGRMVYKDLPGYDIHGMIASTRDVLEWDFELFVGGHGDTGKKADVRRYLDLLLALHDGVLTGIQQGKSLEAIQRELTLTGFKDLRMYAEWRALNIAGVYRMLRDDEYLFMRPETPKVK